MYEIVLFHLERSTIPTDHPWQEQEVPTIFTFLLHDLEIHHELNLNPCHIKVRRWKYLAKLFNYLIEKTKLGTTWLTLYFKILVGKNILCLFEKY